MDFEDPNWSFQLTGPDGTTVYSDGMPHAHGGAMGDGGCIPHITATRSAGRLSLMLQRDSASDNAWVGTWTLMIAYRAKDMAAMVMADIGELMFPVAAGSVRGPRFARLLLPMEKRVAARAVAGRQRHELDVRPGSTNNSAKEACSIVVNIYARTRLRMELLPETDLAVIGEGLKVLIGTDVLVGDIVSTRAFARLVAPAHDIAALVSHAKPADIPKGTLLKGSKALRFDPARVLALLEKKNPKLARVRDERVQVVSHHDGPLHVHVENTDIPGVHHLGIYVEGAYCPEHSPSRSDHNHHRSVKHADAASTCGPECGYQHFTRLFNVSVAVVRGKKVGAVKRKATKKAKRK